MALALWINVYITLNITLHSNVERWWCYVESIKGKHLLLFIAPVQLYLQPLTLLLTMIWCWNLASNTIYFTILWLFNTSLFTQTQDACRYSCKHQTCMAFQRLPVPNCAVLTSPVPKRAVRVQWLCITTEGWNTAKRYSRVGKKSTVRY